MDSAGAVVGPALSLALVAAVGMKSMFLLTFVPGLIAAGLIVFLVREKPHVPDLQHGLWHGVGHLPKSYYKYLAGVGIAGLGDFSNTLLILWATQSWTARFGMQRAAAFAMAFYIGYNLVYTASCYLSGNLADRFPKHWVLATGYALAVVPAVALMVPADSFTKFAVVFGFSGLYMGVWETLEHATAATLLPPERRGTGFGLLATVNGIGDFVASTSVGALWVVSPMSAMIIVILLSLGGAAIIAGTGREAREKSKPPPRGA
jgi:MFS family permease